MRLIYCCCAVVNIAENIEPISMWNLKVPWSASDIVFQNCRDHHGPYCDERLEMAESKYRVETVAGYCFKALNNCILFDN